MTAAEAVRAFVEHYARRGPGAGEPAWLRQRRQRALEFFQRAGFPTTRQEEWKHTSLAPIVQTAFRPADGGGRPSEPPLPGFGGGRLIFLNGRLAVSEPAQGGWGSPGVTVGPLGQYPDEAREVLGQLAAAEEESFAALNLALFADGAFVRLGHGAAMAQPLVVAFESRPGDQPAATHPRLLVLAGEASRGQVVEIHTGICGATYFANAITEIAVGRDAAVVHDRLILEGSAGLHVGAVHARVEAGGSLVTRTFTVGGRLVRGDTRVLLAGEGAGAVVDGLYLVSGGQHVDHHTRVQHVRPHGTSRQLYKGVVTGRGRAVFHGRVVIHPGAAGSDAQQRNLNLVLSDEAEVDTRPQLEVFADEVKCSHGANVGRLDPQALYYLRTRGLGEREATRVLTRGFVGEVVERVEEQPIRAVLEELVERWLGGA